MLHRLGAVGRGMLWVLRLGLRVQGSEGVGMVGTAVAVCSLPSKYLTFSEFQNREVVNALVFGYLGFREFHNNVVAPGATGNPFSQSQQIL